jgi:hypothetical protein
MMRAIGALLLAGVAFGADGDAADAKARFDAEKQSVYDYLPADVTQDVRDAKVAEMDRFWNFVKADVETYRPLLRDALVDPEQNRYFLFDGAALLDAVAEGAEDRQLAADVVARTRLKDIGKPGYLRFVHHLGVVGADISAAALVMLEDPKFQVYLPAHALKLTQANCVLLCALTMEEDAWVPAFLARLETEKGEGDDPDAILRGHAKIALRRARPSLPKSEPKTTREDFEEILALCVADGRVPYKRDQQQAVTDAPHHVRAEDVPALLQARRKIARRLSDEGLIELNQITTWLRHAAAADSD